MLKVVVVEDELPVRRRIMLAVDWTGLNCAVVGEACNGAEGLEVIGRYRPDLVITDIKMPKLDGLEMVRRLREEGSRVCVIFLTAYGDFAYAQSAVRLGAADYLLKPLHDGELEQAVRRVQREREGGTGYVPPAPPPVGEAARDKSKYVMQALKYIARHYNDPEIGVGSIAAWLDISESHLSHLFKKETSYTVTGYLTSRRMHRAMQLLRDCRSKVYEVAEQVGYRDITYFSSTFKKTVGLSPSDYQKSCQ